MVFDLEKYIKLLQVSCYRDLFDRFLRDTLGFFILCIYLSRYKYDTVNVYQYILIAGFQVLVFSINKLLKFSSTKAFDLEDKVN